MAFPLAEQRNKYVCARDLLPARALHVNGGTLDDTLEAGRRLWITRAIRGQARQILIQELPQLLPELVQIHAAGPQHRGRIRVVGESEQQMF